MKVKVNVHLKSGDIASTTVVCESMRKLKSIYMDNMTFPVVVHEESDGSSMQIIPTDNIACINFERVE